MSAMIVVGVDGSAEAARALEYAAAEAARRGARLRVVAVFSMPDYWMVPIGFAPPQVTWPPWQIVIPFTLAAVAGSFAGTAVSDRISGNALTRSFAILLLVIAIYVATTAGIELAR